MAALPKGQRVVVTELGEDPLEAIEKHTQLVEMAAPDPAQLGPRDVLIAVKSASVGWVDLLMTSGQYQHLAKPPYTPGLESAGLIVHKGPEVPERLALGDAVMVDGLLAGPRSLGSYQAYGGFASYVVAPAEAVLKIPAGLGFDQACNLLGSYETAYHALIARGRLRAGETILIHGATGATGLAAVHLAKLVGARVIATGRSDEKLKIVGSQGADHLINVRAEDGGIRPFREDVKALTGGQGADLVYDGVGGEISLETLRALRFGARFLVVGWAATPFVAEGKGRRGAPNANQLPTNLILMKGLDVLGCPTAIATAKDPSIRPARLAQVLAWAEAGQIKPYVSMVHPLADYQAAMRAKWRGEVIGGSALRP